MLICWYQIRFNIRETGESIGRLLLERNQVNQIYLSNVTYSLKTPYINLHVSYVKKFTKVWSFAYFSPNVEISPRNGKTKEKQNV